MEHCEDCSYWKHGGHTTGNCDKIYAYVGEVGNTDCRRWTTSKFGCVLFKPKPKGPFVVWDNGDNGFYIYHNDASKAIAFWKSKPTADGICQWLNDEWKRRE